MDQRPVRQIVIDERWLRTNTPQTKPDKDEQIRVDKIHSHDLILLDAILLLEERAILEDNLISLAVCVALALELEERACRAGLVQGQILEHVESAQSVIGLLLAAIEGGGDELGYQVEVGADVEFGVEVGEGCEDGGRCDRLWDFGDCSYCQRRLLWR